MKFALCALLAACLSGSSFAVTISPKPSLPVTTHGQSVTVFGADFPNSAITAYLHQEAGDAGIPIPARASGDSKSVTFTVPNEVPAGDYLVGLKIDAQEYPVPGELRIVADTTAKVTIDSIAPATDYLAPNRATFDFVIAGQNLAPVATGNTVIAVGYGPLDKASASDCADQAAMDKSQNKICLSYDQGMEGRRLNVTYYHPRHYEGPVNFEVQVGNNTSNAMKIVFSRIRAETLRWAAIAIFSALAGIVFALVWRGVNDNKLAGEKTGVLAAFFLDRQTNSFSLSKFQVIAWTTVAVFGYVYLFLSRVLIQWTFTFPPIPDGLPTLLGVSAGTTVTAIGITANRGSKGSGPLHPSMADFISTGGLIAGERFQFFIWTLIGCLGFLGVILASDPAALAELPKIDGAFLTLMGVSSAGYLAGKLVRQPGPIIELLMIQEVDPADGVNPGVIKIQMKGQNLSDSAVVKIDKKELRIDEFNVRGVTPQDQPAGFFAVLEVDLLDAEAYRTGSHLLYLVNDDGQSACEPFPMNPLTLNTVAPIPSDTNPTVVKLVGRNFIAGLAANWTPPGASQQVIPNSDIKFVDENHLEVSLVPGTTAGTGTLNLITPLNLEANATITITKT